ncbi:Flp family type IVb pilin [Caulobacter sp. S45]|uniref:Flp family type IVb pilin n=1 Tax=Caulobacter sp. S45 TaxID=1641861 RepID=UPI00131C7191|nr:Flp family type IVb pilin [Caulobacter sp. S45]
MCCHIRSFFADEAGATLVEYGVIVALICVAIIGALNAISSGLLTAFGIVSNNLIGH